MAAKKGTPRPATGRRTPLSFGSKKIKRGGKDVTVNLVSKIAESTIKALDIKLKPAAKTATAAKLVTSKSGAKYLPRSGGTNSARRSMQCSADGIAFYNIVVPSNCSYSEAMVALAKNSKAVVFKTPAGKAQIVGDSTKIKAKPKRSVAKKK